MIVEKVGILIINTNKQSSNHNYTVHIWESVHFSFSRPEGTVRVTLSSIFF